jgi:two-component system, cell cycle sensor histidine kinase and response regulator CckA
MNATFALSLISFFFFLAAVCKLISNCRGIRLTVNEFLPLLFSILLYVFVVASNVLEHSNTTAYFDPAEDVAEILFPLVFIFFANNWRQRQSLEDLRRQEAWLRITLESLADGIMTTNRRGQVLQLNRVMEKLTGRDRSKVAGLDAGQVLSFLDKKTGAPILFNPFEEVLTGGDTGNEPRGLVLRAADGETTAISEKTTAIRGESNELLGAVGIFRDMTEYDSMIKQLTHIHKMEAVGQLAGGVAHDLNNMLAGIMGAADLLNGRMTLEEKEKYGNLTKLILKATERASELTANMLAFSRKGKVLSVPVLLQEVIKHTLDIAERTIDKKIRLECHLPDEPLKVIGDSAQLQNCFLNLLLNARDAMPGGGTISLSARLTWLDQDWCTNSLFRVAPGNYVCIEVRDDGAGIPEEMRQKIFEPFFTTKPEGKGTGLGLAAVYGTVVSHHGAIVLHSRVGQGSTFNLYLPATTLEIKENPKRAHHYDEHGEGTILIIDDEAAVRVTAQMTLEQFGYSTLTARSGMEGLEIYRRHRHKIEAVLLDMVMPVMNGGDVLAELRKIDPKVRVIISSGYTENENIPADISSFLKKPYRNDELIAAIHQVSVK